MKTKKRLYFFIGILIAAAGLLIWIFFALSQQEIREPRNGAIPEFLDEIPPVSVVFLPDYKSLDEGSWESRDFIRPVIDEDIGESGLDMCRYSVFDIAKKTYAVWPRQRECNSPLVIKVGPKGQCSSQGKESCVLFVESEDRAGNKSIVKERGEGLVAYSIDWEPPFVGELFLPGAENNEDGYIVQSGDTVRVEALVKDEVGVSNCDLRVNQKSQYAELGYMELSGRPCQNCVASIPYTFTETGIYEAGVFCWDEVGLLGSGSTLVFADYEIVKKEQEQKNNKAPVLDVCRVVPSAGTLETQFEFLAKASDPNNDILEYAWDFGDDTKGKGEHSMHQYGERGTYMPKVTASDGKGGTASCSTAWVAVQ